jgi:hypothetical protein
MQSGQNERNDLSNNGKLMKLRWVATIVIGAVDAVLVGVWMLFMLSFASGMDAFENGGSASLEVAENVAVGVVIVAGMFVAAGTFITGLRASRQERPGSLALGSAVLLAAGHLLGALLLIGSLVTETPDVSWAAMVLYSITTSAVILWAVVPVALEGANWSPPEKDPLQN